MNLKQIIQQSSLSHLEAEILIAFILKKEREFIIIHPEYKVTTTQTRAFTLAEKKRLANWPISYITGSKEFYGLDFQVNKNVLVPRPETEMIVDILLEQIKVQTEKLSFIDIGTGSGAIIVSLAKNCLLKYPVKYEQHSFTALDISRAALKVARQNAQQQKLDKKISFIKSDLLNSLKSENLIGQNLVIAANLPYLTPAQVKAEPSISCEPKLALEAGKDGLKYYRQLLKDLKKIKFTSLFLILEIDPEQTKEIKEIIKKQLLKSRLKIIKDLRKNNRFAIVEINQ
jgi:release factor glutamine methyltransferase